MKRYNIYTTGEKLKETLGIKTFCGEQSYKKSANVGPGDVAPVVLHNGMNFNLQTMRWDRVHAARIEALLDGTAWTDISHQRCVVVAKGYYLWHKEGGSRLQPYYVQGQQELVFIAALYRVTQTPGSRRFSFVTLTKPADDALCVFANRMPLMLPTEDVSAWLNHECDVGAFLNAAQSRRIELKPLRKIGLWVNDADKNASEECILRPADEWEREKDAQEIGLDDDDFPFDAIEAEAMKELEARKQGREYEVNWDELKEKNGKQEEDSGARNIHGVCVSDMHKHSAHGSCSNTKRFLDCIESETEYKSHDPMEPPSKKFKSNGNTDDDGNGVGNQNCSGVSVKHE